VISGISVCWFVFSVCNYWIVAARMKRMAVYKSSRRHITPFKKTVGIKSLLGIDGATGMKPAIVTQ
jgi:hypothetical protein